MDEAPEQAQQPDQVQTTAGNAALPNSQNLSVFRTPLGGLLSQYSAARQFQNPLLWHMTYWLDLGVVGVLHGQDPVLMAFRIRMEQEKMDPWLKDGFRRTWKQYRTRNLEECVEYWVRIATVEAKGYLGDIDRMLVNKAQKARNQLILQEELMHKALRELRFHKASKLFMGIVNVYEKLVEEETRDAQLQIAGTTGVTDQGGQSPQEIEGSEEGEILG